ncbi:MAG TPA: flagellar basal-body MS-ring/collar protein FliF [Aquabacterium sp.]|uniref:flagellar basal-body MS-ring/collar protein FliF n=1 Tax=Aquabacterium sp. TaxID=1872578 RepID=UPI002E32EDBB|nr:flagellar basal-body MS-ring/collar protein FliF [Aquabacterium sp.]HEX5373158.1 flagellar basal-body MS-ring/collar protein FliF [Aquabacterium sp.]
MEVTIPQPQALAPAPDGVLQVATPGFAQRVMALPAQRKFMLGGGVAVLLALMVAMVMWSQQADYKILFANLSDKDGGAILAQLQQMNVPYKHVDGGSIMVPADKVHDVRLKLASAGLPKGSVTGYELMENQRFGVTQFQERLNFQRGLEGELTRSIQTLSGVESARVHLALPNQNGFFREQQKASASVILSLYAGRTLDKGQIAGIVHLVSSSVPEMSPKAVSVVDQSGALLSAVSESGDQSGMDAQQLQYVRQMESNYTQRIRDLLEPVVGSDNLRAQVTADLDFSQVESTAEEFKPNQNAASAAVRSQQTSEQVGAGSGAVPTGVPGAMSNQPPTPATAPVNGASQPLQAAQNGLGAGGNSRRDAVTNYEVDKTVRVTRNATGTVKRLTAAVVINHITKTDAKGKTTTEPMSQEDLDKLTALVKESIGFSEQRGDSVKVINTPFQPVKDEVVDVPFWKQPDTMDMLRTLVVPGAMTALALIVVFGAIRPAINAAKPPPSDDKRLHAVVDDAQELPGLSNDQEVLPALGAPTLDSRLDAARKLAKENPVAVANIVRSWVNKD